ncbi:MAG: carboxypeptidase-like regulatory domain-containing protein, partial [Planctomycetota bacterium]
FVPRLFKSPASPELANLDPEATSPAETTSPLSSEDTTTADRTAAAVRNTPPPPQPLALLQVRVVDDSGKAAEGASVALLRQSRNGLVPVRTVSEPDENGIHTIAVMEQDLVSDLPSGPNPPYALVWAEAAGLASSRVLLVSLALDLNEDEPDVPLQRQFEIALESETRRIRGRIIDKDRSPVSGVSLSVKSDSPNRIRTADGHQAEVRTHHATSDANGEFEFAGLSARPHLLFATREDLGSVRSTLDLRMSDELNHIIKMWPGVRVQGQVVLPDGEPAPGAIVRVGSSAASGAKLAAHEVVVCDADGRFKVSQRLAPTVCRIVAQHEDLASRMDLLLEEGKDEDLRIELSTRHVLHLKIVDEEGAPMEDVEVQVTSSRGYEPWNDSGRTDSEGLADFFGVPRNALVVSLADPKGVFDFGFAAFKVPRPGRARRAARRGPGGRGPPSCLAPMFQPSTTPHRRPSGTVTRASRPA